MPTLNAFPVRLKFEPPFRRDEKDTRSADFPRVPRGNDMAVTAAVYFDGAPLDLSNLASLRLELRSSRTATATLLAAVDVLLASITTTITDADWRANLAQHATFVFTAAQMNQDLAGADEREFFLVLSGLTADGKVLTYGFTKLVVVEDVAGTAAAPPPEPPVDYYTQAQVNALLAARALSVHTHTRAEISDATAFGRARMADADEHVARAALGADWGYTAPAAIAAAGETQIALAAGQRTRVAALTVNAGAVAFVHIVTLQAGTARAGDELVLRVSMPASYNPLIDVRSLTAAGTQLATLVGRDPARTVTMRFRYDGAGWMLCGRERNAEVITLDEASGQFAQRGAADWLNFAGGRVYWALGASGAIGASDFTVALPIQVPVSTATDWPVWAISSSSSSVNTPWSVFVNTRSTSPTGSLQIRFYGSATSTDQATAQFHNFVQTYGGQFGWLTIVRAGNTLLVYFGSALVGTVTPTGSGDATVGESLNAAYFHLGQGSTFSGLLGAPILFNRALSQAEVSSLVAFRQPSPADAAGGSAANSSLVSADPSFENGTTALPSPSNATVSNSADFARTGTRSHKAVGSTGTGFKAAGRLSGDSSEPVRWKYFDVECWIYIPSGQVGDAGNIANWQGLGIVPDSPAGWTLGTADTQPIVFDQWFRMRRLGMRRGSSVGSVVWLKHDTWPSDGVLYVDDVNRIFLGAILQPEIGRTAQARDRGPNGIHGLLTPGVTPLPARTPQREAIEFEISATGFLGGDQPIYFDPHLFEVIELIPTTATIPTVTIRRGSSSGTIVVNAASAGTQNAYTPAALVTGARQGAAMDRYHVTLSTPATVRVRLATSPL